VSCLTWACSGAQHMIEGWYVNDYLILFDEPESEQLTEGYRVRQYLPELTVVGILGWDDFILRDQAGQLFRAPTVPLLQKYVDELEQIPDASRLTPDVRFSGKIKWYTKPVVFGGDPRSEENMIWVDIQKHQALVQWWNQKYKEVTGE
jgi:hypothetical protein